LAPHFGEGSIVSQIKHHCTRCKQLVTAENEKQLKILLLGHGRDRCRWVKGEDGSK
jgi:hypothetical protein